MSCLWIEQLCLCPLWKELVENAHFHRPGKNEFDLVISWRAGREARVQVGCLCSPFPTELTAEAVPQDFKDSPSCQVQSSSLRSYPATPPEATSQVSWFGPWVGQWTLYFQCWRTSENMSQGVLGIFSLIITSQMYLTWTLLVNGFGSPRKLTKKTSKTKG